MSGELIRYNGGQSGIVKVSEARRKMDLALATLRGEARPVIEARREPSYEIITPRQVRNSAGAVIDLPRVCALHDRLYVSRYVQAADGFFHYGQGIRITSKSSDQYDPDMQEPGCVTSSDLEDETCAWCGASGFAAILCAKCKAEVCYGRTLASNFFHCRERCGSSGRLAHEPRHTRGLRPQLASGANPLAGG